MEATAPVPCRVDQILCPTEFSPPCPQILATATRIAAHFDARVRVLHVCKASDDRVPAPVTIVPGRRDPLPDPSPPLTLIEDMRTLLNHVAPAWRETLIGEVATGGIRRTILDRARDAQLVVMGTRGLTGLPHTLLGSVAESIVARSPCPVLTLRPESRAPFPRARVHTLKDGPAILIRPIVVEDRDLLLKGVQQMSHETRYRRFLTPIRTLSEAQLRALTKVDYRDHMAWGAVAADDPYNVPIGSSRYSRLEDEPEVAEAAVVVIDAYQRRGIGSLLLKALTRVAVANGIKAFRGYVLKDNVPVRRMLEEARATLTDDGECLQFDVALPASGDEREDGPMSMVFKALARFVSPTPGGESDTLDGFKHVVAAYRRLFR